MWEVRSFTDATKDELRCLHDDPVSLVTGTRRNRLTLATTVTGLISVYPADCTPTKEKKNPRTRERRASPTFIEKSLARMTQHMIVLNKTPLVHHNVGIRSSIGVRSSSSALSPSLWNHATGFQFFLNAFGRCDQLIATGDSGESHSQIRRGPRFNMTSVKE